MVGYIIIHGLNEKMKQNDGGGIITIVMRKRRNIKQYLNSVTVVENVMRFVVIMDGLKISIGFQQKIMVRILWLIIYMSIASKN